MLNSKAKRIIKKAARVGRGDHSNPIHQAINRNASYRRRIDQLQIGGHVQAVAWARDIDQGGSTYLYESKAVPGIVPLIKSMRDQFYDNAEWPRSFELEQPWQGDQFDGNE